MSDGNEYAIRLATAVDEIYRKQAEVIEECAERILLSGTNWGIEVHTWIHDNRVTITAEPTPATRTIIHHDIVFGPPTDDFPHWVPCPASGCKGGMVGGTTGFTYDYPWPCGNCEGRGWVQE